MGIRCINRPNQARRKGIMQTNRVEYPINSGYIQIVAEGNMLPAFWAHPDTGGTFPGVAVAHDRMGLTPFIRHTVRRFAQAGHYVIAPDLFNRQVASSPAEAQALITQLGEAGPPYIAAAIGALTTHNHCNGDIAVVGYGFGGTLALHMNVHRDDLKAVVAFNADMEPYRLLLPVSTIPLLSIYGMRGTGTTGEQPDDLQAASAAAPEREVIVYPEAGPTFYDNTQPDFAEDTASTAWLRVLKFLDDHTTDPSQPPGIHHKTY